MLKCRIWLDASAKSGKSSIWKVYSINRSCDNRVSSLKDVKSRKYYFTGIGSKEKKLQINPRSQLLLLNAIRSKDFLTDSSYP